MQILEGSEISIPLERPFFFTTREVIDVKHGKLTFEVRDENIEFLLSKLIKIPTFKYSCCRFDIVEKYVNESPFKPTPLDIVEVYLVSVISQVRKNKVVKAYEKALDESFTPQNQSFKIKGLALAHGAVVKGKMKPLPTDLKSIYIRDNFYFKYVEDYITF